MRRPRRTDMAVEIGARIARGRLGRGWRQAELGALVEMRVQRLSLLENGHHLPNVPELVRLSRVLEMSIDQLVLGTSQPPALLEVIQRLERLASAEDLQQVARMLEAAIPLLRRPAEKGGSA